jgi:hypothetical protein
LVWADQNRFNLREVELSMLKLEELKLGLPLVGLEPSVVATVAAVVPIGEGAVQVFYRAPDGTTKEMRRMVKEELVKFDGTPLFPERRAYTVNDTLSEIESALYEAVTNCVKTEMGKADQLGGSRKGSVSLKGLEGQAKAVVASNPTPRKSPFARNAHCSSKYGVNRCLTNCHSKILQPLRRLDSRLPPISTSSLEKTARGKHTF